MPQPRSTQVSLSDTPWYHVVSRCVRRAYLCGEDAHSGQSFEHRRGWIAERLQQLAGVFAVDVAAYAVMSNHFHVVLRVDAERVQGWEAEEVLRPFDATGRLATAIPFAFEDYAELVETTGRVIRADKRGFIPGATPALLERLHLDPEQFIQATALTLQRFGSAIGTPEHLTQHGIARNLAYLRGIRAARALFDRRAA